MKQFLGLSNETIDQLAGLTRGHYDKIVNGTKHAGPMAIDALLGALAIELHVKADPNQTKKVAGRWTRRDERQIRERPVTRAMIDRVRPIILQELGLLGEPPGHMNGNGYKG